ncbi:MAG: hypothetical protein ACK2T2_04505, partial [Anaerolineales bacterium]
MPLLLLGLLVIAGAATWLMRSQAARTQWALSAAFAASSWLFSMALLLSLPVMIQFSVWQPEELFKSPLLLSLD